MPLLSVNRFLKVEDSKNGGVTEGSSGEAAAVRRSVTPTFKLESSLKDPVLKDIVTIAVRNIVNATRSVGNILRTYNRIFSF